MQKYIKINLKKLNFFLLNFFVVKYIKYLKYKHIYTFIFDCMLIFEK